jgi:hypothetical protein
MIVEMARAFAGYRRMGNIPAACGLIIVFVMRARDRRPLPGGNRQAARCLVQIWPIFAGARFLT